MSTLKSDLYYVESGQVNPVGALTFLGLGALAALGLGAAYAYLSFYIPLVYVNLIIAGGFGFALGWVAAKIAKMAKVRNASVLLGGGFLIGLLGLYFAWVFWIHAFSEFSMLSFNPGDIFNIMQLLGITGVWEIFGSTPTGGMLYLIWALEAIIIIGVCVVVTKAFFTRQPYCEDCNTWTEEMVISDRIEPIAEPKAFIQRLEAKDFTALTSLERVAADFPVRTKVEISDCPDCNGNAYLTVELVKVTVDDEGKTSTNLIPLVENLKISHSDYMMLKDWRKDLNQTLKTFAAEEA